MAPRKSAAIVLTREAEFGAETQTEVYLALRSPDLRFFGGYHAFPGGVIDPEELAFEAGEGGAAGSAFARCAERELFEEIGVALDPGIRALAAADRRELRQVLIAAERKPGQGAEGSSAGEVTPREAIDRWRGAATGGVAEHLETVLEITTPPFAPRRYETEFFHAELPAGEEPDIWPGELVGGEFMTPARALERWRAGEILIAPPVLLVLTLLEEHGVTNFAAEARAEGDRLRGGKLHPVRFSPGIFVAPLEAKTKPPATTTNCFLIGEASVVIVDPAPTDPAVQRRLFDKLDEVVADGAKLSAVWLTHAHPDHVGAVVATAQKYGLPVGAHPEALGALRLDDEQIETFTLEEGDEIDLGVAPDATPDWKLRVLHTPGHSPDHLAFVESRYGACVVGDLMSAVSTVLIDPPEGHLRTYFGSLERLLAEPIQMVYPSHGPAVHTGHQMVRHFIRHRQSRIDAIHELVRTRTSDGGVGEEELLAAVYHDTDPRALPMAMRSLAASLEYLAEDERVQRDGDRWTAR